MRNPRFKEIKPNYRRNVLEIILNEGRRKKTYYLPFSAVSKLRPRSGNRVTSIKIDNGLNRQFAELRTEDGRRASFSSDLVLYHCDPAYDWAPINQLKRALKGKLKGHKLSVRVLADALQTSPSQVTRLLEENRGSKQLLQLLQLAEIAGYCVEFKLKKKGAA